MKKNRLTPGEWQTDEQGQRFRMVGNCCKEYEMILNIDGFQVPESELEEFHKLRKAAQDERLRIAAEKQKAESQIPHYACPFQTGLDNLCKRDQCALYIDGCQITNFLKYAPPAKDTKGLCCPISNNFPCRTDCVFYKNGCMFTGQIKKTEIKNNE